MLVCAAAVGLTEPAKAAEYFVARSGVQLLAVAVGNVHGKYAGEPKLRWDVLLDIAANIAGLAPS